MLLLYYLSHKLPYCASLCLAIVNKTTAYCYFSSSQVITHDHFNYSESGGKIFLWKNNEISKWVVALHTPSLDLWELYQVSFLR